MSANLEFGLVLTFIRFLGLAFSNWTSKDCILWPWSARTLSCPSNLFIIFRNKIFCVKRLPSPNFWNLVTWALISVDFRDVNKISCRESITEGLLKPCVACTVSFSELLFSKSKGLRRGFAMDFGHKPVALHPALIICADKASFLALQ